MPKKLLNTSAVPTLVQERLRSWGACIHAQRLQQRITAADLCTRIGVSAATLRRLEKGDPGASGGAYLSALLTLGIFDFAAPALDPRLYSDEGKKRVKPSLQERKAASHADYF